MAITFAQLLTIMQANVADASNTTFDTQCLNLAQSKVARARRWPELMTRAFFNTVAAYDTGTIAVTTATTQVTLTTGTWPTDLATGKYRFALSITDPWYEVTTRTSGSIMDLAQAYQDATQTASDYIVYKSHYSLASTVDRVEEMWIHTAGDAIPLINAATDETVSEFIHYPSGPGVPTHFYNMERDSSNNRQVLLGPETPDDVYRVEYVYRKKTTDGTYSLDESRWPVVMALALSLRYAPKNYERSQAEYMKYLTLLKDEWENENEVETQHVRVGDDRVAFPGEPSWASILGRGEVQDPS